MAVGIPSTCRSRRRVSYASSCMTVRARLRPGRDRSQRPRLWRFTQRLFRGYRARSATRILPARVFRRAILLDSRRRRRRRRGRPAVRRRGARGGQGRVLHRAVRVDGIKAPHLGRRAGPPRLARRLSANPQRGVAASGAGVSGSGFCHWLGLSAHSSLRAMKSGISVIGRKRSRWYWQCGRSRSIRPRSS